MTDYICVSSLSDKSGDIWLNRDFFLIKGKHFKISDWYLNKSDKNVAIPTRDIISMEFIKYRSKKTMVFFIIVTSLFLAFGKRLYRFNEDVTLIMVLMSFFSLIIYLFGVKKILKVTAKGITVAVDTMSYDNNQLVYMMNCWNNMFLN